MVKPALQLICSICLLQASTVYAEADPAQPSIELLDYLADIDIETNNDIWIDPLQMKELAISQVDEPTGDTGNE